MMFRDLETDPVDTEPTGAFLDEDLATLTGVDIPPSFLEFLLRVGGRSITQCGFKIAPYEGTFAFPHVYSLHRGYGEYALIDELKAAREINGIPPEVIPFACEINGPYEGVMYLDLTTDGNGRVLVFATAKPGWIGQNTEDAWLDVSEDFDGYVELLTKE